MGQSNDPDYHDMHRRMLSEIDAACRMCGERYVDASGQVKCRRSDCPGHRVREKAMSIASSSTRIQFYRT